jgi:indole-3-glycerol phosphate synthase
MITLTDILKVKRQEVNAARNTIPMESLREAIQGLPPCRDFYRTTLNQNPRGLNVIAEIKKASPSSGLIRPDFDPITLAKTYQQAGANALSVLTDETFFQGQLEQIAQIKEVVDLPILRKDFIVDPYQIFQSRIAGADAILLIAEALDIEELKDLLDLAHSLSLTTLLEIHDRDSLLNVQNHIDDFAQKHCLLGINNRNLKTMQVDIAHSLNMIPDIRDKNGIISESGIKTRQHIQQLTDAGFNALLIGETLMRQQDLAKAFAELFD